jgi:hypothetical protein
MISSVALRVFSVVLCEIKKSYTEVHRAFTEVHRGILYSFNLFTDENF